MPSFVFWNAHKGSRLDSIRRLADDYEANFLMVAECGDGVAELSRRLADAIEGPYHFAGETEDRVKVFTSYNARLVTRLAPFREERVVVFRVDLPLKPPFLLAALHLNSKLHGNGPASQLGYAGRASAEIAHHEAETGIDRTVAVGDFNMDPYEPGMVSVDGFHAIMDRRIVTGSRRKIGPEAFEAFYNPMWGLMGDLASWPPGSLYHLGDRSSPRWHTFDQVILRPGLVPALVPDELQLVASPRFAVGSGRPGGNEGSDHFPLRFTLNV